MLFNSPEFLVFLPIVFGLYWFVTPRHLRAQNLLLLVASYVFYGWWDWRFLGLIALSTLADFFESAGLHPSFLLEPHLIDHIQSPVFSMREAVATGTMEVFKYSDTHLAPAGAKIVGEHLNGVLKQWAENQPY